MRSCASRSFFWTSFISSSPGRVGLVGFSVDQRLGVSRDVVADRIVSLVDLLQAELIVGDLGPEFVNS